MEKENRMEIIVQGIGKKSFAPDKVKIELEFYRKEKSYEETLKNGTKDVEEFMIKLKGKDEIQKDDMKTRVLRIYEDKKYDYETKKEISLGFVYQQMSYFELNYSASNLADFIEKLTRLESPPKCHFDFSIENMEKLKNEAIELAFENAKLRAESVARAAGKELVKCIKVDFKPFENGILYGNGLNSTDFISNRPKALACRDSIENQLSDTIEKIFVPEKIVVEEAVYCLWIAE